MAETAPAGKSATDLADVRRILVATKYRFIGDTLLAAPLLRAIAGQWPNASVTLLTGAKARELMLNCPYISEVVEFDPYRASDKGLRCYRRLVGTLRERRFDLAFVCNRSFHSALTAALAGARLRVGWSGFEQRDFLLTHTARYDFDAPEAVSYLDLFRSMAPACEAAPALELWVTEDERRMVADRLPLRGSPLIGLQPGATHDEKRWAASQYADLAECLLADHPDTRFVVIGGPEERPAAERMIEACGPSARSRMSLLAGDLQLRETLAALTYLDLFVAGDTAIRHAAVALDIPSVALFGPTSIRKWGNARPPRHAAIGSLDGRVESIGVQQVCRAAASALATSVGDRVLLTESLDVPLTEREVGV